MKYLKAFIYSLLVITFLYLLINLNSSIEYISIIIINFFKTLFPYLFLFFIVNQLLIKTKILYLFSFILEPIIYPIFKINSKEISLILISLLNGSPSSFIYGDIMLKNNDIDITQAKRIAPIFFVPSYTYIFYAIKPNLPTLYFNVLIFSLYIPMLILLLISRNKSASCFIGKNIFKEIYITFISLDYIKALKDIFTSSISNIVNILGMISFYSIITITIPNLFIKALFEFSYPSLLLIKSNYSSLLKTYLLLIIFSFTSLSSITQASIFFYDLKISFKEFIKKRVTLITLSLSIFTLFLFFYFQ